MIRRATLGVGALVGVLAACNSITGAGDIRLSDGPFGDESGSSSSSAQSGSSSGDSSSGSGPATSGASTGTASSSSASSGSGAGGDDHPPQEELGPADGVAITDVDVYQAVQRPVVRDGAPVDSSVPIVANKDALVRVFYTTDGGYDGSPITARLHLGSDVIEVEDSLSGSSQQSSLSSTINFEVPGSMMAAGTDFRIEVLQPSEQVSGANDAATWPAGGTAAPLGVEAGPVKLKILLVPVQNNGSLPDTSSAQVERYHRWFLETYPVPEVQIEVRSQPYVYNGNLGSYNGWSNLLDQITDLRDTDNAPADVYYYGIHNANSGGLLGLGWVGGQSQVWSRTAIGVGWTGETAPETAVHELGHNHGRDHSPCGVSGDPAYPHSGASIGVWGYSASQHKLLSPNEYVDFMSYCSPQWVSDWTYIALFNRAKVVSSQPYIYVPPELLDRSYDRIKVIEDQAWIKDRKTLHRPPDGEPRDVIVTLSDGSQTTLSGHYFAYNHFEGGLLYVMRPANWGRQLSPVSYTFQAEGRGFVVANH